MLSITLIYSNQENQPELKRRAEKQHILNQVETYRRGQTLSLVDKVISNHLKHWLDQVEEKNKRSVILDPCFEEAR